MIRTAAASLLALAAAIPAWAADVDYLGNPSISGRFAAVKSPPVCEPIPQKARSTETAIKGKNYNDARSILYRSGFSPVIQPEKDHPAWAVSEGYPEAYECSQGIGACLMVWKIGENGPRFFVGTIGESPEKTTTGLKGYCP